MIQIVHISGINNKIYQLPKNLPFAFKWMTYEESLERLGEKWLGNVYILIGDLLACGMNLYKVWTHLEQVFFNRF